MLKTWTKATVMTCVRLCVFYMNHINRNYYDMRDRTNMLWKIILMKYTIVTPTPKVTPSLTHWLPRS